MNNKELVYWLLISSGDTRVITSIGCPSHSKKVGKVKDLNQKHPKLMWIINEFQMYIHSLLGIYSQKKAITVYSVSICFYPISWPPIMISFFKNTHTILLMTLELIIQFAFNETILNCYKKKASDFDQVKHTW